MRELERPQRVTRDTCAAMGSMCVTCQGIPPKISSIHPSTYVPMSDVATSLIQTELELVVMGDTASLVMANGMLSHCESIKQFRGSFHKAILALLSS